MPSAITGSFWTHAGYLHALSYLCGYTIFAHDPAVVSARLSSRIKAEPSYTATTARPGCDEEQVKRSLDAAWGSELLLALTGAYAPQDLLGVSNSWVAIQAYYACYHATQALVVAKGNPRPTSHPKTQKMFVDAWVTPPRDLAPWSLGASHNGYENLPGGHVVKESVHQWSALDAEKSLDLVCKALRTTRQDFLIEARKKERHAKRKAQRKAWDEAEALRLAQGKKPRKKKEFPLPLLTAAEKTAIDARTKPFGVLHYLYRLRIKAQYEDSTLFSEGPETHAESLLAFQRIEQIVRSTLLLHELFIERIIGRAAFERLVDDRIKMQASAPVNPLAARRSLILP